MRIVNGDLFDYIREHDAVMHQANCFNCMGGGFAGALAVKYPKAREADDNYRTETRAEKLGHYSKVTLDIGTTVYNIYSQYEPGGGYNDRYVNSQATDYEFLKIGLIRAVNDLITEKHPNNDKLTIAVPYMIGCGIAGGDIFVVEAILRHIEYTHPEIEFVAYKL